MNARQVAAHEFHVLIKVKTGIGMFQTGAQIRAARASALDAKGPCQCGRPTSQGGGVLGAERARECEARGSRYAPHSRGAGEGRHWAGLQSGSRRGLCLCAIISGRRKRGTAQRIRESFPSSTRARPRRGVLEMNAIERACRIVWSGFKRRGVTCGARTRKGTPCKIRPMPWSQRCRLHGGLSTGPKTPEGRARIAEAQRKRWAARKA